MKHRLRKGRKWKICVFGHMLVNACEVVIVLSVRRWFWTVTRGKVPAIWTRPASISPFSLSSLNSDQTPFYLLSPVAPVELIQSILRLVLLLWLSERRGTGETSVSSPSAESGAVRMETVGKKAVFLPVSLYVSTCCCTWWCRKAEPTRCLSEAFGRVSVWLILLFLNTHFSCSCF